MSEMICPQCAGTGSVTMCDLCNGHGFFSHNNRLPEQGIKYYSGGKGKDVYVSEEEVRKTFDDLYTGTGFIKCEKCHGRGYS